MGHLKKFGVTLDIMTKGRADRLLGGTGRCIRTYVFGQAVLV